MPKNSNTQIPWGSVKESKQEIVDAAARCFERYGPQRTSMDDIAEAAGISRKSLYRVFSDRPKLVQAVLECQFAKIAQKVKSRIAKASSFEEALLEGFVTGVSSVRDDELANTIILKATDHTLEQFIIKGNDNTFKFNLKMWQPVIEKGRQEGIVKSNLSDERITEIISSIYALLTMLDEPPEKQRAFLKDVLIPAIMIS